MLDSENYFSYLSHYLSLLVGKESLIGCKLKAQEEIQSSLYKLAIELHTQCRQTTIFHISWLNAMANSYCTLSCVPWYPHEMQHLIFKRALRTADKHTDVEICAHKRYSLLVSIRTTTPFTYEHYEIFT